MLPSVPGRDWQDEARGAQTHETAVGKSLPGAAAPHSGHLTLTAHTAEDKEPNSSWAAQQNPTHDPHLVPHTANSCGSVHLKVYSFIKSLVRGFHCTYKI